MSPGNIEETMRKTKMMLLGVLLATAGASWTATAAGIDQYALKEFTADFTQFHIGDTVSGDVSHPGIQH